jgi:hypothetical protein
VGRRHTAPGDGARGSPRRRHEARADHRRGRPATPGPMARRARARGGRGSRPARGHGCSVPLDAGRRAPGPPRPTLRARTARRAEWLPVDRDERFAQPSRAGRSPG